MNTDELRSIIWDNLFQARSPKSIEELAALTNHDVLEVRMAVNHDWFNVTGDHVAIAMATPGSSRK